MKGSTPPACGAPTARTQRPRWMRWPATAWMRSRSRRSCASRRIEGLIWRSKRALRCPLDTSRVAGGGHKLPVPSGGFAAPDRGHYAVALAALRRRHVEARQAASPVHAWPVCRQALGDAAANATRRQSSGGTLFSRQGMSWPGFRGCTLASSTARRTRDSVATRNSVDAAPVCHIKRIGVARQQVSGRIPAIGSSEALAWSASRDALCTT